MMVSSVWSHILRSNLVFVKLTKKTCRMLNFRYQFKHLQAAGTYGRRVPTRYLVR